MQQSRIVIVAAAAYLIVLHLLVAVLIWKTDIYYRVSQRLGFPAGGNLSLDKRTYRSAITTLDRIDAMMQSSPVVLFGDSRTQDIPPDLAPKDALNLGIGGLAISSLAKSIKRYPSLGKASTIVLAIGVIDECIGGTDATETARRLTDLVGELPPDVRVVWSSVLPVDPTAQGASCRAAPEAIKAINRVIASLCAARPNCVYSDGYSRLSDAGGNLAKDFDSGDGLHLSRRGYEKWLEQLRLDISGTSPKRP
ncbi:MAG: GDSL-type esterase/lipase family protein [Usitatibacter sp.]